MINDRIASIYEQLQRLLNINVDIIQEISSQNLVGNQPNFDITNGLFKVISNLDPEVKLFFDSINYLLQSYLENTVFDMEWEFCLYCDSENITSHGIYTKDMKDLVGSIQIKIRRYRCKDCDTTFTLDNGPFNLDECQISLPLSRLMVALYTGGLSMRLTADIINSTYWIGYPS